MKIYKANRKGYINYLIAALILITVLVFLTDPETFLQNPFILLPLTSPTFLLLWLYLDTGYKIENGQLIYRSGFLRGKIEISKIHEVTKGKTMWSGIKPALTPKGLIIKYNKYDDIYIAPENNDEMIADLLHINPEIKIKNG